MARLAHTLQCIYSTICFQLLKIYYNIKCFLICSPRFVQDTSVAHLTSALLSIAKLVLLYFFGRFFYIFYSIEASSFSTTAAVAGVKEALTTCSTLAPLLRLLLLLLLLFPYLFSASSALGFVFPALHFEEEEESIDQLSCNEMHFAIGIRIEGCALDRKSVEAFYLAPSSPYLPYPLSRGEHGAYTKLK